LLGLRENREDILEVETNRVPLDLFLTNPIPFAVSLTPVFLTVLRGQALFA